MAAGMMAGCSSKPQETTAAATETETTVAETTEAETEAESENAGEAKADLGEQSILAVSYTHLVYGPDSIEFFAFSHKRSEFCV